MPLVLQPALEADAARLAEIEREAFASNDLSPILFPGPFPPDAGEKRAQQLITQLREDPTTRWMKAIDTETNELVGFAKWNIIEKPLEPRGGLQFGPGSNIEACEEFFGGIRKKRSELMGGNAYCRMASSLPSWHQGVSDMLLTKIETSSGPAAYGSQTPAPWSWRNVGQMGS